MSVEIKLLLLMCTIYNSLGHSDVCVVEPLLTSSVPTPICDQSGSGPQTSESQCNDRENQAQPCNISYKYRKIDGSCNNLRHPTWGMSSTAYPRILPAYYRDRRHLLALQTNGEPRPLSRVLANELLPDRNNPDKVTLATLQWGQIVVHDIALTMPIARNIDCCSSEHVNDEEKCLPIIIPPNDVFYSQYGITCKSAIRSNVTFTANCHPESAAQINSITHAIDASLIYGSDVDTANALRTFEGGTLKTSVDRGRCFLPNFPDDQKQGRCFLETITEPCYMAGDLRINTNSGLTVFQNMFLREHNRVAKALRKLHPEWDDETIYQESRAIVIAEYQNITYKEWLKYYIGTKNMIKFDLFPRTWGYTIHNRSINFMVFNSFTAGIFRDPHSGIQGSLSMYDYSRVKVNQVHLSDWMNRPKVVQDDNNYDQFLLGLTNQHMQKFDEFFTDQIRNTLFHGFKPHGGDLISVDIERGRDHGLGPYVHYLQVCTGYKPETFEDLGKYIHEKHIPKLQEYYNTIEDIDLFVGIALEMHVDDTRFGPTTLCIITEQFYRLKWGDRFWYEVGGQPHSFTMAQLHEIRKSSLSRLICDNSDNINRIAVNSFLPPSIRNIVVDCKHIPKVNLNYWK